MDKTAIRRTYDDKMRPRFDGWIAPVGTYVYNDTAEVVMDKHPSAILPGDWEEAWFGAGWKVTWGFLGAWRELQFYGRHTAPCMPPSN